MLSKRFQTWRGNWLAHHPGVQKAKDLFQWFEFHVNRGKGFFNTWIDFAKLGGYVAIVATIVEPLNFMLNYIAIGLIISLPFFILWSQVMDLIKYDQSRQEFGNKRNDLATEQRTFMLQTKKEIEEIKKLLKK